ncbi:MAG: HAD family hydrolase [Pseudomonas piscis]|uniref:HAD family hydrolase n=1 Tax=Pseudomonas piscis TaxID=2614538 RepID=UPI003D2986AC
MTIKLITFDLDDTLWDTAPVIVSAEATLRQWLAEHAPDLGGVPVEHLWTIRAQVLEREPELKHRISALRRRVLFHALEEAGYEQAEASRLAAEGFEVFLHARHQLDIFPEVQPTLEALANHFALGVVTNGNADVRRLGLADYFQFALCAEDIGIAKPDARLFQEALQRGGASADTAVHIGDHPGDDIAGAQQAGLRAIWFNPGGKTWEAERAPDAQIRSLTELPALLGRWKSL